MLIFKNKLAKISDSEFNVYKNQDLISRVSSVKYLGVFIDDELLWTSHTNQVALYLFNCNRIICELRNYVNRETLPLLYYSLEYFHIQHGITL